MARNKQEFFDYYERFGLDRSKDIKHLKKELTLKITDLTAKRSCIPPSDETLKKRIEDEIALMQKAMMTFSNDKRRKAYDTELDKALKAGRVNHEENTEIRDILEKARRFFDKGQYELAVKFAKEVIDNNPNSPEPYIILCRSKFLSCEYDEAVELVDKSSKIFANDLELCWLAVRYNILIEDIETAQRKLNEAVSKFGNVPLLAAEQIYLYFYINRDEMAMKTVQEYLSVNPNDNTYKKYVAYNILEIANYSYLYDPASEMLLLTEEKDYNRCLEIVTAANRIYQDERTTNELKYIKQFGDMIYDEDNRGAFKFNVRLSIIGLIATIVMFVLGNDLVYFGVFGVIFTILCAVTAVVINSMDMQPRWKVIRDSYRGFNENEDNLLYVILTYPYFIFSDMLEGLRG